MANFRRISRVRDPTFVSIKDFTQKKITRKPAHCTIVFRTRGFDMSIGAILRTGMKDLETNFMGCFLASISIMVTRRGGDSHLVSTLWHHVVIDRHP